MFGDRLAARVAARESQLVLGIDPDPARLWPGVAERAAVAPSRKADRTPLPRVGIERGPARGGGSGLGAAAAAAAAVAAHCELVIEAVGEECVAVKLQVACFERLGAPGWAAMAGVAGRARERGLLVIADAKRGDIDVTAAAYAQAFFGGTQTPWGELSGVGADALTVNPLLGVDSLEPLVNAARGCGAGLFVLVRSSNPGAADVQELALVEGGHVSDRLAAIVEQLGSAGVGRAGLSDVGAVVAATAPARIGALRARMPRAIFLLPGVGAQGGSVEELAPAFAPGRAAGLIASSRGVVHAHERTGGSPAGAARAEAARLRELAWKLSS